MGGDLESQCIGRVYGAEGAGTVHTVNTTYPSKKSVQKTMCCNSTSNAPDDRRMGPKHVELRVHQ